MRPSRFFAALALTTLLATPGLAEEPKPAIPATQGGSPVVDVPAAAVKDESLNMLKFMSGDHALGDPKAPVTIIEYASLSCSHCAQFNIETFPGIKEKYIDKGQVFFIYRHFPFNEPALRAAMLADCSGDKFFPFIKVMFKTQSNWAYTTNMKEDLRRIANTGGMSNEAFDACMANKDLEDALVAHTKLASENLQVKSTPTLFVNGERIEGARSFEDLSVVVDKYLAEAKK